MAGTNPDEDQAVATSDDKPVTEDDLRSLKYSDEEVETSQDEDETSDEDDSDESDEDAVADDEGDQIPDSDDEEDELDAPAEGESTFVKKFPNIKGDTPEEYARNVEIAYENSTAEALRLKGVAEAPPVSNPPPADAEDEGSFVDTSNPLTLYAQQKMDEDIKIAYGDFKKDYTQVEDKEKYLEFKQGVAALSDTILRLEKRQASPKELYRKTAAMLGWEKTSTPSSKEELGMAIKQNGAASKSSPATKPPVRSKVTAEMVAANKKMYPDKTEAEIRKELEPHIQ